MSSNNKSWKQNFFDECFKVGISKKEFINCIKYKNQKLDCLYQYTKVKHAKGLICDKLMFLREIKDLNDPFEGDLLYDVDELYKIRVKYNNNINLTKKQVKIDADEGIELMKRAIFISCFSEENNITPMWGHYADNHKGICLKYDFNKCEKLKHTCFPISYIHEERNMEIFPKIYLENENYEEWHKAKLLLEAFSNKSPEWEYEKEWRIIIPKGLSFNDIMTFSNNDKNYINFLKPSSVFLGKKKKKSDADYIKDLCDLEEIEVYKMKKDTTSYNLTCELYEG